MAENSFKNHGGNNMLAAVLEHYARYQNKKHKKRGVGTAGDSGEDSFTGTANLEVDSIYRSSINGRWFCH